MVINIRAQIDEVSINKILLAALIRQGRIQGDKEKMSTGQRFVYTDVVFSEVMLF